MKITKIIWKEEYIDKIERKHDLSPSEVEEVLHGKKTIRRMKRGNVKNEDVYLALGQTEEGRYLSVFFIWKKDRTVLPISARDMDPKERKRYKHGK